MKCSRAVLLCEHLNTTKCLYSLYSRTKEQSTTKKNLDYFVDVYIKMIYSKRVVKRTAHHTTKEG